MKQTCYVSIYANSFLKSASAYSRTSTAQTLMALLPCLTRTHSLVPMVPYNETSVYNEISAFMFSYCFFYFLYLVTSSQHENYYWRSHIYGTRVPGVQVYIETNPGWLELSLDQTNFHGPSLFEQLKLYCI